MTELFIAVSKVWQKINNPDIKIIDASWHLDKSVPTGGEQFQKQHIAGACFFDINLVADTSSDLPHMMPDQASLSQAMSSFGIGNDDHIIVYDNSILHTGLRLWWMLKAFGHKKVSYMDGGLAKWMKEGHPVTHETSPPAPTRYVATLDPEFIRNADQIYKNITTKNEQVIDARSNPRFTAETKEARAGLRSGHIPESINVPFNLLFNEDGTIKNSDEIEGVFKAAGTDFTRPLITSCGSGVTACILLAALNIIGKKDVSVYDGSWTEWGGLGQDVAPVVTGKD